ncbi:MAG: ferritin-like domain-containing protein [Proteobacteria bacterium]|nr:ferritin-like domain-containing protein [Pseudomonadota bacterium]
MNWDLEQTLSLSHLGDNQSVNKIIHASLRRKKAIGLDVDPTYPAWEEDFFLLNQSKLFQSLPIEKKNAILKRCNDFILCNSYFIEKAGLAYCAKMILLGKSTEIRQIYGLIASDESMHLAWLTPYIDVNLRASPQGQFIRYISTLIEECSMNTLYYLIQTILEGWGIFYYKTLSKACKNSVLQQTFLNIVKDEALHHQTGVTLFDSNSLSLQDKKLIIQGILGYIDILRAGPQDIVHCIQTELGILTQQERQQLFEDLQTQATSTAKLNIFKQLLSHPFIKAQVSELENQNAFLPYTPDECAKRYCEIYQPIASV